MKLKMQNVERKKFPLSWKFQSLQKSQKQSNWCPTDSEEWRKNLEQKRIAGIVQFIEVSVKIFLLKVHVSQAAACEGQTHDTAHRDKCNGPNESYRCIYKVKSLYAEPI